MTRQQILHLAAKGEEEWLVAVGGPLFLPVDMPVAQSESRMGKGTDRLSAPVELQLCFGRNLRFEERSIPPALARLIHAVEAA